MAVEDKYVNSALLATSTRQRVPAQNAQGGTVTHVIQTFETAAADDDGSVYRIFKNIPATAIPLEMRMACDAITSGSDYDFGLYLPDSGAVVDKDVLADGLDPSSGYSRILALDLLATVDLASCNKNLWELARDGAGSLSYTIDNHPAAFDLCLTANTVGSSASTITIFGSFWLAG